LAKRGSALDDHESRSLGSPDTFLRRTNQVILDLLIFMLSYLLAFLLRFEGPPQGISLDQMVILFPYLALARMISYYLFSVYSITWRYVSVRDAVRIFEACLPPTLAMLAARLILPSRLAVLRIPIGIITMDFLLVLTGTLGTRLIRRLYYEMVERERYEGGAHQPKRKAVLLIGAGNAGNITARELRQRADLGMEVVGFIDDDPAKRAMIIQGIRVLGDSSAIPDIARRLKAEEAVITIANASSKQIRRIVAVCEKANLKVKIIPSLFEMLDDRVKISRVREVDVNDLLGRNVVTFEKHFPAVTWIYRHKRILVTGAGGSIGSELCRQLSVLRPREIILLDKDENGVFEIEAELHGRFRGQELRAVIANIKNRDRMEHIFGQYKPEIVFHAAAHKHVPLMESNASEAVINNVVGTRNLVELADKSGVERFIFVSTDKAINPTSVMGATKKLGEIIVQNAAASSPTRFSCVRFGNVLGSRGSVVPLFQKQIERGGPVTITHPDVRRYFMSISESVQLIIQAGTIGTKGEILALDMGEQIKISDLAKDLIKLSGYKEDDIDIRYIGLRPGEKLYEEILVDAEIAKATSFEKIFIVPPPDSAAIDMGRKIEQIIAAAEASDEAGVIEGLREAGIGYSGDVKAIQGNA
jgi:FlaA1/EpsC-like NDP-sugar epimerase